MNLSTSPSLEAVLERFSVWRDSKKHLRERIPEELWSAALSLLPDYGSTYISKELRLNLTSLKQAQKRQKPTSLGGKRIVEFSEVNAPFSFSSSLKFSCHRIELERGDGCRMSLYPGKESIDVEALVTTFLKEGSCYK